MRRSQVFTINQNRCSRSPEYAVDELQVKSYGLIRVDGENGFKVRYSARGKRGYIKKYKTENIVVKNGFLTKIFNDPSALLIWTMGIIIWAVCRTYIRLKINEIEAIGKVD